MTDLTIRASLQDGIYFNLPADVYLAIPRLSASGIRTLNVSPAQFWVESWMNPDRKDERDTSAKAVGKAYHKLLLEGEQAFLNAYAVAPSKDDYPDALDGLKALQSYAERLGVPKSGTIADLCARIRAVDDDAVLWPEIMADFRAESEGLETISGDLWKEMEIVRYALRALPEVRNAFNGGAPEVSILWTDEETGVPLKARLDYLKPGGVSSLTVVELKTFSNHRGRRIDTVPAFEIASNGYFVQPCVYAKAVEAVRRMGEKAFQADAPESLKHAILHSRSTRFVFVFVRTGGVPEIIPAEFSQAQTFGGTGLSYNEYWRKGELLFRRGVELYRTLMANVGPDRPWVISCGVQKLTDLDFPVWALETSAPLELGSMTK